MSGLRHLCRATRGGVSVIGALSVTATIGMSGLAVEASQGYAEKVSNQRIADAAALAAAMAYNANRTDPNLARTLSDTAQAIAAANGVAPSGVSLAGPTADGPTRKLISVTVTTSVPLRLTRVLTPALSYGVSAKGVAAVSDTAPGDKGSGGCIIALSSTAQNGVALSGGTGIVADGCVVVANAPITLNEGGNITARQVISGGAVTRNGGSWIKTTPEDNKISANVPGAARDPLAASAALKAALDKADDPSFFIPSASITDPDTPNGGKDWYFDWNGSSNTVKPYLVEGGVYVVPPPAAGQTYRIRKLTVDGGVRVTFQGASTVTINNGLVNGSNPLTIGDGSDWKVNGGIDTGSGGMAMGNSSLAIGQGNVRFNNFSIGNGNLIVNATANFTWSTISIGAGTHAFRGLNVSGTLNVGEGDFISPGQLKVTGGTVLNIAGGPTSRIAIGDTGGTSIFVDGGSTLKFGASKSFVTSGGITTAGGTNLIFGAAANHFIKGTMNLAGSASFGSGAYTINGDFTNGTGGAMTGTDVSFFMSGRVSLGGGSGVDMRAPQAAVGEALPDILFATRTRQPTSLSHGANMLLSGVWWSPYSAFVMDGGTSFRSGSRCFTLVADTVTLREGGAISGIGCPATGSGQTGGPATLSLIR
ncbi:pilus assembly protein TadG-related protein [Sphingomonas quercus]|uniref:Flp pilus-assembly TadG-like N-terminal domain-containing protein n=1 Tax=Sphingomonas quercus TaxID=2842451 RepID=A0ABS6BDF2_9SPHN|nr:pilus assembly protein TadG-related protein [Sphingomonas quercus]MBU3076349.1 hypothetical protein [Sphingomonas quercus]